MHFSLDKIIGWLMIYRYEVLLPLAIAEGPIVAVISGFVSSLGMLNFWIAYAILIFGDLVGDTAYYALGYWGRSSVVERILGWLKITPEKIAGFETFFHKHAVKTLLFGKWGQVFGMPILITAGAIKMDYKKYMVVNLLGTGVKVFIFLLVGFYFGTAYRTIGRYLDYFSIAVFAGLIVLGLGYLIVNRISKKHFEDPGN